MDFRGQFSFSKFNFKLYIEGTEVPLQNFQLLYKENEPTRLSVSIAVSKSSKNFISNVLCNKPTVILTIKGIGEHYSEDWHIAFIGYVIDYHLSIGPQSINIGIEAIDFLNLLKETKLYNLNPAIHWLDIPYLYKNASVIWSADELMRLLGTYLKDSFIDALEGIVNFTALYTTVNVVKYKKLTRKYGTGAVAPTIQKLSGAEPTHELWFRCCAMTPNAYEGYSQFIAPRFFSYPKISNSNAPPPKFSMIQYSPNVVLTVEEYFAGYNYKEFFDNTNGCWNVLTWQTLCFYLNRLAWVINEFYKWATRTPSDSEDYEGFYTANWDYRLALGFSNKKDDNGYIEEFAYATIKLSAPKNAGWRGPGYSGSGAKNSMHKCAGAADICIYLYKKNKHTGKISLLRKMHLYELIQFASLKDTFLKGGRGLYSSSITNHYMHVDIGPKRSWGSMPHSEEKTTFSAIRNLAYGNYQATYSRDYAAAFNSLFRYFVPKVASIVSKADAALIIGSKNFAESKEKEEAQEKAISWAEKIWTEIQDKTKFPTSSMTSPSAISLSDHSPVELNYGLVYSRVRKECSDNIELTEYIAINPSNYKHNEYKCLPWAGKYRDFIINSIIAPKYAARWSITGKVIKQLVAGQAATLSNIEYSLWDIVQLFLSSLLYQFVPIPFGGLLEDRPKLWAVIPRIETVDIDGTCVPIPETNVFYATGTWSDITYSVSTKNIPTAIAGLINVGDASVIGDQTSTLSYIASLYPIDLALKVEGDNRDMKLRTEFTIEENWRGPHRVYKDYDLFRLGLMSAELAKSSKAQQYIELFKDEIEEEQLNILIHDMTLRDYYASVLGQNNFALSVGYWPYVLIGYPAKFVTDKLNIYGIVNAVSISGSGNHIHMVIYLRNSFTDWDKPYRILQHSLGQPDVQSIYDPWLLDIDLANIKCFLTSTGAAKIENNKLSYLRTRQLFYVKKLTNFKIRKQMKDLVDNYAKFLRGIAMARAWDLFSDELVNLYSQKPKWYEILDLLNNKIVEFKDTNE